MKNLKKIVALLLCAVLLVVCSVAGTLAYLQAKSEVVNTFTFGEVKIELDETDVDLNGTKDGEVRVKANEYKLIPGHTYIKDPVIHVDENSENCFLYVKVINPIAGIEAEKKIETQLADNGWTLVDGSTDTYYYKEVCGAGYNIPTFTQFTVRGDVQDLSTYEDVQVIVTAYAVQVDGFADANAAWAATYGT